MGDLPSTRVPPSSDPKHEEECDMVDVLTPIEFQKKLVEHGYNLPQYGADGYWGEETAVACDRWFEDGADLNAEPEPGPAPGTSIVPDEWMPDCTMLRVIVHWTAGAYAVSATDKQHYHIIVGGDSVLVRGDNSIEANVSTNDNDGYAAHTKNCNSGSIGVSAACMAGAVESPFKPGAYPLKQSQWQTLAAVVADLCRKYDIPVTNETVLQHGEVEDNLNIPQDGKWDICKLPWQPSWTTQQVGDDFRSRVSDLL